MPDYTVTVGPLPQGQQYIELEVDADQPPVQLVTGQSLTVDTSAFSQIDPALFQNGVLSYSIVTSTAGAVTTQGAAVTLTSAPISTTGSGTELTDYNTLAVAYNKLQADVAALNTNLSGTGKALV